MWRSSLLDISKLSHKVDNGVSKLHFLEFGSHIYVTAPSCYLSKKTARRHKLKESNLHSHSIILHYSQTPSDISECAFKFNITKTLFCHRQDEI